MTIIQCVSTCRCRYHDYKTESETVARISIYNILAAGVALRRYGDVARLNFN